jgi:hypothetical protein
MGGSGNTKIAQQQRVIGTHQHVFRLDIAVDEALLMGILQGRTHLSRVLHNSGQWHTGTLGMAVTQSASRGVVHHEEGFILPTEPKVEQGHDVGVMQTKHAGFIEKRAPIIRFGQTCAQDFESDLGVSVEMLGQVDIARTTAPKPFDQAIVTHALPKAFPPICHVAFSRL